MKFPAFTLRRTIATAVLTVVVLAMSAAGALVGLTTVLHRSSVRSASAVESVRFAEETQRDLLLHASVVHPSTREKITVALRERLAEAQLSVSSSEQRTALGAADQAVRSYLAAEEAIPHVSEDIAAKHARAFDELEHLVDLSLADWQRARENADRYDRAGTAIGVSVAAGVIFAGALLLRWLDDRALRPLLGLAAAIRRFGRGSIEERASEDGPAELAEMARQFNEMAESIAQNRKDRQAFLAGVAHDLRNPLAVLKMSAALVEGTRAQLDPDKVRKMTTLVQRQVARLDRMVGDLLDSASVAGGGLRLRLGAHDLCAIAAEVVDQHRTTTAAHTIVLDIPGEPVRVSCDRMRIEQVLSNLVSNAIKYSPNGGRVSLSLRATPEDVTFAVHDEGIGMSEEDTVHAFEPFRRSSALRDEVAGSGLGLFVVRTLVEAHSGRVDVRSTPGMGSTFEVHLPRRADAAPLDAHHPHGSAEPQLATS